ncbi:hypothetical protein D3C81_1809040 [compost metagenome]
MGNNNLLIWQLGKFRCKFTVQRLQSFGKLMIALLVARFMLGIYGLQALLNILSHNKC